MLRVLRFVRNGMIGAAIVLAAIAYGAPVKAEQYGNCSDVTASWDWATLTYCGPFQSEEPVSALTDIAYSYVTGYGWGSGVYMYWWGRDTPFDEDAYYSAGFQVY
jgi:hypothetical protein